MRDRDSRRLFEDLGTERRAGAWRWVLGTAAAVAARVAVFASYLNPHLALDLATRVWACF
ncbi:MAG: hypothetical protein ACKOD9_03850 [Rubrivivax sp.]